VILYKDGTLLTRRVTTNLVIEVDEAADSAPARSSYVVFQQAPREGWLALVAGRRA
jgi:hypothetical protein